MTFKLNNTHGGYLMKAEQSTLLESLINVQVKNRIIFF